MPVMDRPLRIRPMPSWPGARAVVQLAIAGAKDYPPIAPGAVFADGTRFYAEYQLGEVANAPEHLYEAFPPPLLSVLVIDMGRGIGVRHGVAERVRQHEAEKALKEIEALLGPPVGILNKGIDQTDTRRRYWWRVS